MIELIDVSRSYGGAKPVVALGRVSLRVGAGERVAVMGPSGSGKSTLLNLICGLDQPTTGSILIGQDDMASLDDDARTRLRRERIGMIFQTFNLLPTLTAVENVALPLRLNGTVRRQAESRARVMLGRVGLGDRADHRPDQLSGGERQRMAIARALIFAPPLLLADEPTGNLDSRTGDEILNLLDQLHAELNTTILLVTHNEEAVRFCQRLIRLRDGHIVSDARTGGDGV